MITLFVGILDYILIQNHPNLLELDDKKKSDEHFTDDDIEDIINSYEDDEENSKKSKRMKNNRHRDNIDDDRILDRLNNQYEQQPEMMPGMFQTHDMMY